MRLLKFFFAHPVVYWQFLANLLPLVGVLFLGWDIRAPVLLYCVETALMVIFFAARILVNRKGSILQKAVFVPFFCFWYCALTLGETAFALVAFYTHGHDAPKFLGMHPGELWTLAVKAVSDMGLLPFFLSMGLFLNSQLREFISYLAEKGPDEDIEWLVFKPFGRVALVVLLLVPGGILLYYRGSILYFALMLTMIKICGDLLRQWLVLRSGRKKD